MSAVAKAMWLAAANVLTIAIALSFEIGDKGGDVVGLVMMFTILPALIVGAICGRIAEVTQQHRPFVRIAVVALPACGLVAWLAAQFAMWQYVPHACIPTLVAVSILERTTRRVELIPVARV
jgi:hypothetical protein